MTESPAKKVITAFGGVRATARRLTEAGHKITASGVCRWARPREKRGLGGRVPWDWHRTILRVAEDDGLTLTREDLEPPEDADHSA